MGKIMDIIFGYSRTREDGQPEITFDVRVDGKRTADHRAADDPASMKTEADLIATARRYGGFKYLNTDERRAFVTAGRLDESGRLRTDGTEGREIVEAFQRQGYEVRTMGAYRDGAVLSADEIEREAEAADLADRVRQEIRRQKTETRQQTRQERRQAHAQGDDWQSRRDDGPAPQQARRYA